MRNKLKTKNKDFFSITSRQRKLCMPKFPSTCPSGHAADATASRCTVYHWIKRINKIPRAHMKGGVLEQILGGGHTQHVTND